jgi:hypothetical protein
MATDFPSGRTCHSIHRLKVRPETNRARMHARPPGRVNEAARTGAGRPKHSRARTRPRVATDSRRVDAPWSERFVGRMEETRWIGSSQRAHEPAQVYL